ncbi:nucleotidyltransferase family protein [Micromonospora sp. DT81.3]|uniref:nucleotidyltransferase family protein n=1 Tax=Micromonospora sp. DT81.3 TaxID=3416523 RepID=UPI003CE6E024
MLSEDRLRLMARELCAVGGVRAVALGGSRARGTHRPDSDIDLGLYFEGDVDRVALDRLAARWTGGPVTVASPGAWGPWVESGAWLVVEGTAVDWILRDARRVAEQCERARLGHFAFHTQPGHPLGFLDVSYAGEVAMGVPLCDETALLAGLAEGLTPYPEPLRAAMLQRLWQVDFLLDGAEKGAKGADAAYVALCAGTAAMIIAHAWHALAGRWVLNEKGLVPGVSGLPIDTRGFAEAAASVLSTLGSTPEELHRSIAAMRAVPRP